MAAAAAGGAGVGACRGGEARAAGDCGSSAIRGMAGGGGGARRFLMADDRETVDVELTWVRFDETRFDVECEETEPRLDGAAGAGARSVGLKTDKQRLVRSFLETNDQHSAATINYSYIGCCHFTIFPSYEIGNDPDRGPNRVSSYYTDNPAQCQHNQHGALVSIPR